MNIAIIGASQHQDKFSNKAVRAYLMKGWTVYPVNPRYAREKIEGLKCYASILDIKEKIDLVSFYVPPETGRKLISELVIKGITKVYLNPGSESDIFMEELGKKHIEALAECSILAIGMEPGAL